MTVSVVIPTFNRGPRIQATLDSVIAQTLAPLEIVVVDDGSTDGTSDWIEEHFGDAVRVVRQKNGGVARARNRGWREAKGEWIAFLDHDDLFHPDKLATLAPLLKGDAEVVVSRWREIENGQTIRESPIASAPVGAFAWLFGWNNPLVSMSVPLVRRSSLQSAGGFDPRCVPADDWDLWLRLAARRARFVWSDAVTTDYILHPGQQRRDEARMFRAVRRTLNRHPRALATRPLLLWWLVSSGAFVPSSPAYERFKRGEAGALVAALRAHPLSLLSPQWVSAIGRRVLGR